MTAPRGLARKSVGGGSLFLFAIGASSPMTVLAGGVVATFATTGVVGVPLSFLVLGLLLAPLTAGFVMAARHLSHAATAYALLAQGLGRAAGVAGAAVALLTYNAIQVSLYGLIGANLARLAGGPWWAWSALAWLIVAVLGVVNIQAVAKLFAFLLIVELAVIVLFDVAAFVFPDAGTVSLVALHPARLFTDGIGGVFALGIAAFVGYECGPAYGEEVRTPATVVRTTFVTLVFLAVFYALSSWAMTVVVGPGHIVRASRDSATALPFTVLSSRYAYWVGTVGTWLLVSSALAAALSFHNTLARYVFALARERVLPAGLARIGSGRRSGAPVAGSVLQSGVAAIVVVMVALSGGDPMAVLFTWLSTLSAVGMVVLLTGCSAAAARFFLKGKDGTAPYPQAGGAGLGGSKTLVVGVPIFGALLGVGILAVVVWYMHALLGVAPHSTSTWVIAGLPFAAAGLGLCWAMVLRVAQPAVYAEIGQGRPHPLALLESRYVGMRV